MRNLTSLRISNHEIRLVSDEHDSRIGAAELPNVGKPLRNALEGFLVRDVVDDQRTDGAAVVRARDGPVSLLARGVPDLKLRRGAVDPDHFGAELDADGLRLLFVEDFVDEAVQH